MIKPVRTRYRRPVPLGNRGTANGQIPLNRNHVFESTGPEGRVRGSAQQLAEKYRQLGRDAQASGDRVQAEAFFQHAEHYGRTLNAIGNAAQAAQQERAERQQRNQENFRNRQGHHEDGASGAFQDEKRFHPRPQRAPKFSKPASDANKFEAPAPWRPSEDPIERAPVAENEED